MLLAWLMKKDIPLRLSIDTGTDSSSSVTVVPKQYFSILISLLNKKKITVQHKAQIFSFILHYIQCRWILFL